MDFWLIESSIVQNFDPDIFFGARERSVPLTNEEDITEA